MKNIKMVTGTGSSGTTFFIHFLEELGLTKCTNLPYDFNAKGGFEFTLYDRLDVFDKIHFPNIIKDPRFMFGDLEENILKLRNDHEVNVDDMFICFRDFDQSAKSRIERNKPFFSWKDLEGEGETIYDCHIDFFRKCLQKTVEDCMKLDIELTFIDYNKMDNPFYLHKKLKKVYPNITLEEVTKAHAMSYVPKFKNTY